MTPNIHSHNAYEILGVPRDASIPTIRKAFKKLALKHHPDTAPPEQKADAAALFAKINQAHETLRDPDKRKQYDQLLDRGETPDLSKDLDAQAGFLSLADIIGEIGALDFAGEAALDGMDFTLRMEMVEPNLIRGEGLRETVVEAIQFTALTSATYVPPEGVLTQGWLLVTELRVLLAMIYTHTWQEGNTQYTKTYYRMVPIPYGLMNQLLIHESGRAYTDYKLEVGDEEGSNYLLTFSGRPRFEKLLLIANTYKLPLRIARNADSAGEYGLAFMQALGVPVLWAAPFLIASLCNTIAAICPKSKTDWEPAGAWGGILVWMNDHYLTTVMLYATPLAAVLSLAYVYLQWNTGHGAHLFGELALDYADGAPALPGGGEAAAPEVSSPGQPAALPQSPTAGWPAPSPAPAPVAMPEAVAYATPGPAPLLMPEAVADALPGPAPLRMPTHIGDASPGPAPVLMPEAVADALPGPAPLRMPTHIGDAWGAPPSGGGDDVTAGGTMVMPDEVPPARPYAATVVGLGPSDAPASVRPDSTPDVTGDDFFKPPSARPPRPSGGPPLCYCPRCGQQFRLPPGSTGSARCTDCGHIFPVG